MRSLLVATCLTALLGAHQGFAADTATKPQAAVSSESAKSTEIKPAVAAKAPEVAKAGDAPKTDGNHPAAAKTPAPKAPESAVAGAKVPAEKAPEAETKPAEAKATEAKPAEAVVKAPETVKPEENKGGTVVEIKTSEGTIKLELADREAPVTVRNFLTYVNEKFYDGTIFHRVIEDFMIQGGGYVVEGEKLVEKPTKVPIINEAKNGLKNNRGTIAMARMKDPNSATAQFYINQVNNSTLDYPSFDGHGYAVFGKVIDGIDVVDKVAKTKTGVKGGMTDVPLADVKILSIQVVRAAGH